MYVFYVFKLMRTSCVYQLNGVTPSLDVNILLLRHFPKNIKVLHSMDNTPQTDYSVNQKINTFCQNKSILINITTIDFLLENIYYMQNNKYFNYILVHRTYLVLVV